MSSILVSNAAMMRPAIAFHTQPTPRFHGSVPAMLEEVKKQIAEGRRVLIAVPNTGEVERLADIFSEYASLSGWEAGRAVEKVMPTKPPISPAKCSPPRW